MTELVDVVGEIQHTSYNESLKQEKQRSASARSSPGGGRSAHLAPTPAGSVLGAYMPPLSPPAPYGAGYAGVGGGVGGGMGTGYGRGRGMASRYEGGGYTGGGYTGGGVDTGPTAFLDAMQHAKTRKPMGGAGRGVRKAHGRGHAH